jgi:hypothetical protein
MFDSLGKVSGNCCQMEIVGRDKNQLSITTQLWFPNRLALHIPLNACEMFS